MLKKVMATALAAGLLVSMASCGAEGANPAESKTAGDPAQKPESAAATPLTTADVEKQLDGLTVSWYTHYDWATDYEWGTSPTTKWIQDNLGVTVNWIVSGGAAEQKLTTMIASNELPDLITLDRGPATNQLSQGGALIPLNEYAEKYPNLKYWATEKVMGSLKDDSGNIYGVPSWYTNEKWPLGNEGIVLNRKYYDLEGRPSVKNMDELYGYLKTLKEKYPEIQPLTLGQSIEALTVFYTLFEEGVDRDAALKGFYKDGDQLKNIFEQESYREALLTLNKFYREGLISSDDVNMLSEQYKEKGNNGKFGVMVAIDALGGTTSLDAAYRAIDPDGGYFSIEPPAKTGLDPKNIKFASYSAIGWNWTAITTTCKEPERAYALLDWLTSDVGYMTCFYGPEGQYWNKDVTKTHKDETIYTLNDTYYETKKSNPDKFVEERVGRFNPVANGAYGSCISDYEWSIEKIQEGARFEGAEAQLSRAHAYNTDEYINIIPDPTTEEGIVYTSVLEMIKQQNTKVLLAKDEAAATAELDKAVQDAQTLNYAAALDYMTERWQNNLSNMGK